MSFTTGQPIKALYLASDLDGLQPHIYRKMEFVKGASAKSCCASADAVFLAAGEALRLGDEERAYVLYMKYMEILKLIRRKPEYKKDERYFNSLLGLKKFEQALSVCERLQTDLKKRYTLSREEEEAKRLIAKQEKLAKQEKQDKTAKTGGGSGPASAPASEPSEPPPAAAETAISCAALNALIKQESTSYLIVDVRPAADFSQSRLAARFVVNVPAELVRPGVTAPALEAQLPEPSRQLFARRRSVDRLILLDWGDADPPGSPLHTLRDAMVKWEMASYSARPAILTGGYQLWVHTYPLLTTNPQARLPAAVPAPAAAPLSFQYPSLEEPAAAAARPAVDRSVKPPEPAEPAIGPSQPASGPIQSVLGPSQAETRPSQRGTGPSQPGTGPSQPELEAATQRADALLSRLRGLRVEAGGGAPGVPSRALKPQLDEAATRRQIELSRSRLQAEQDWQRVRQSRELQLETELRLQLQQQEHTLLEQIRRLEQEQTDWDAQQARLRAENEALRQRLAAYEPPPDGPAAAEDRLRQLQLEEAGLNEQLEAARRLRQQQQQQQQQQEEEAGLKRQEEEAQLKRQAEEEAKLRRQAEEDARLKRQAEEEARVKKQEELKRQEEEQARLKRQEEEVRRTKLEEEARRKKQQEEEARRSLEERRRRAAEEQRRLEEQERRLEEQERRSEEQERRQEPLRSDGGSGGLKRSHSSPFIAGLGRPEQASERAPPAFSRETKPQLRSRRGDVQAARARRFAPSYGSVDPALTGLKNLGNTCYMNAVVQCINNTPGLSDFFVSESYQDFINYESELSGGEAAQELAAAVKVLWSGHYRSVALYDLKDVMGRHHSRFRGSAQQDAHEFLMYLLDFLHEDLNEVHRKQPLKEQENDGVPDPRAARLAWDDFKASNRSFILNLFWGQHKSTLRCSRCGNQSVKFETFSHLSVPMPARSSRCSLSECIQLYLAGDTISGWTCPKCRSSSQATKRLDIWRLPPILIIHIQRFYNDGLWRKKQSNVQFPLESLDMSPYVINKEARYRNHQYHLYGVVNHFGSMESGHYTAFCRGAGSGRWHKFDDHEVYQLNSGGVQSSAGYILFYSAIDGRL